MHRFGCALRSLILLFILLLVAPPVSAASIGMGAGMGIQDGTGVLSAAASGPVDPTQGILTSDRDFWPNWKVAGLLSQGGIPALGSQCGSTVNPTGVGATDTAAIASAISACSAGEYVQLGSGANAASFSGYISGTTLTVTSAVTGTIAVNQVLSAPGIVPETTIISGSGTSWVVSYSQTVGASAAAVAFTATTPFMITEGSTVSVNQGIVLNGSGAGNTILMHPAGQDTTNDVCNSPGAWGATLNSDCPGNSPSPVVQLGGAGSIADTTTLSANGLQGSNTISVTSATGFSVGGLVLIDELANGQPMPDCCFNGGMTVTASVSTGGVMNVSAVGGSTTVVPGGMVTGTGVPLNSVVEAYGTNGTTGTGGTGTYQLTQSPGTAVGSETLDVSGAVWAEPDYTVEWNAHNPAVGSFDSAPYSNTWTGNGDACDYSQRCGGVSEELHLITGVAGTTITLDTPLTHSYRTANSAQAYAYTNSGTNIVHKAGLQNLTVAYGDNGNVQFSACVYCWAQNVESTVWLNAGGFAFYHAAYDDQEDTSYAHYAAWPVNGGGGYANNLTYGASGIYIVNSIAAQANKVIVVRASGSGSVVAYNYFDDSYINGNSGWIETGDNDSHLVGSQSALNEGNQTDNYDNDFTHGNSSHMTIYRNWLTGFRQPFIGLDGTERDDSASCCGPQRADGDHPYSYWNSHVGNIVGYSGLVSSWNYRCAAGGADSGCSPALFNLGWNDTSVAGSEADGSMELSYPTSPTGANATITGYGCTSSGSNCVPIVDGNYDFKTNSIQYDSRGVVSLPSSFYLNSGPAFFSGASCTWPWLYPLSGGIDTLPAKARFDAGTPFTAVPCGGSPTNGILANPTTIASGGTTYLSWNSTNAASCAGTNFSTGSLAPRSSLGLAEKPSSTTTYTVTCGAATPSSVTVTVTGGGTNSTWNPSNKSSEWTLSNGNLTATNNTGGSDQIGANTVSHSSGLYYAEFQCNTATGNIAPGIWVGNTGNYNTYLGDGTKDSFGFFSNGQYGWNASPVSGAWSGCVTGDTVGMEVNFSTSTAYIRTYHSGVWGSFSSGNSFSGIAGTSWYLAGDLKNLNDAMTVCDNTTSCGIGPLPGGYSWWQ